MGKLSTPRKGSLQFWPRVRAKKFLPRVNWNAIPTQQKSGFLGFIGYKAGMKSAIVRDETEHSLTKKKRIAIPITIIECPKIKILSVRFYKNKKVVSEVLSKGLDKELKRKLKIPKEETATEKEIEKIEKEKEFDDVRIVAYSTVKSIGIKKTPDLGEIALSGTKEDKLKLIKEKIGKEISVSEVFGKELIDSRGITKGYGAQGPVKRFGIKLKFHKSEKGVRRPGSIGPWHPSRVTFRVPMAGQTGFFTRVSYNQKILLIGNSKDNPLGELKNYGRTNGEFLIVKGSIQGPAKRQIILTKALRPTKKQEKLKYEIVEIR